MTSKVGIIGYPVSHSISPIFQQAAFDFLNLNIRYETWEIHPSNLSKGIADLRDSHVLGFNVTVPHKESIMSELDQITQEALEIGAVNTVVNSGEKLVGHNTDGSGFIRALKEEGKFEPKGKTALIIGAGGSAKAVAYHLIANQISRLIIANRTSERAEKLKSSLNLPGDGLIHITPLTTNTLTPILKSNNPPDLIVNCTSLGMIRGPDPTKTPLNTDLIPVSSLVFDLVYNPLMTPLIQAATQSGARILTGLPMLIYQGALAFQLWSGHEPPIETMFHAARQVLE